MRLPEGSWSVIPVAESRPSTGIMTRNFQVSSEISRFFRLCFSVCCKSLRYNHLRFQEVQGFPGGSAFGKAVCVQLPWSQQGMPWSGGPVGYHPIAHVTPPVDRTPPRITPRSAS